VALSAEPTVVAVGGGELQPGPVRPRVGRALELDEGQAARLGLALERRGVAGGQRPASFRLSATRRAAARHAARRQVSWQGPEHVLGDRPTPARGNSDPHTAQMTVRGGRGGFGGLR
jgi:hypothetical protein